MNLNKVFSVNGAISGDGELICKKTLRSVILEIVTKLSCHSPRDFSGVSLASITEIDNPELVENNVTLFFRVGIIYCEIKAYFNKKELSFNDTHFGVRY